MPHSSDLVTDDGEYQDDFVTLNGVNFLTEGPIQGGMVSEFSTGLKIGAATYDEREHAFWVVLEDFTGGFGFRQLNIREAGGTHWDNVGGIDLRRPRHITLPPRRNTINPDNDPSTSALFGVGFKSVFHTDLGPDSDGNLYVCILDAIYTLDSERTTLTRRYTGAGDSNAQRFGRIVEGVTGTGTRFLLGVGTAGTGSLEYVRSTNGTSWTKSSGIPTTPSANASMQLSDAIFWDGLIIAHGEGDGIIGSADGVAWDTTAAGVLDPRWHTGDISVNFIGVAMAPWGSSAVYFLSLGKLWILDWYVYNAVEVSDVGDSNRLLLGTVWNGSVIVSDGWNVWEYNPGNAQTVRRIGMFGKDGPPTSWMAETGHPGTPDNYQISHFIPGTSDLYAVCRSLTGTGSDPGAPSWRLAVYNGVGWSWIGSEVAGSQPYGAIVDSFPTSVSLANVTRAIDIAALDDQSNTNFTLHTYYLPTTGDSPFAGSGQRFEDGPLTFETGWFDGGFSELEGVLLRLSFDGYQMSATETVRVEYRLNNQEEAAYLNLGTYTLNQQEKWFTDDHRGVAFKTVQFRITLDRGIGVKFSLSGELLNGAINDSTTSVTVDDSATFRIGDVIKVNAEQMLIGSIVSATNVLTVTRGHNSSTAAAHSNNDIVFLEEGVTPMMRALTLLFDKKPRIRTAWTIRIDVSRMVEREFSFNGQKATTEKIWNFLKGLVNTPRLIQLQIPSLEPVGINVRITDMPATITDFRKKMGGRGTISLQVIETVGP